MFLPGMSNVLAEDKRQQVLALGRLSRALGAVGSRPGSASLREGGVGRAAAGARAAGDRLRGAAREASRRLAGEARASRNAGRALDGAVRDHRSGLQGARRLIGAGLTRIRQHIEQREQARDREGPSR